ncbi:uncharacterized protein LOC100678654 isoform X1 [Nasonia vitripennis]|uniref:Uncharacterized protein n=1 Tax=Nasonia vitripennis TaxID=7425 RepID=A0A7M7GE25_NASVI|nr:uncharacterized protein LOC100678654 isoform X1 [Nasonia vitripennis]
MNKASVLLSFACALCLFVARNGCEAEVINDIDTDVNRLDVDEDFNRVPLPYFRPPCCKQIYTPLDNAETNRLDEDDANSIDIVRPIPPPLPYLAPPPMPMSMPSESERSFPIPIPPPPTPPGQWFDAVVFVPMQPMH